jgi:hypothetical protein
MGWNQAHPLLATIFTLSVLSEACLNYFFRPRLRIRQLISFNNLGGRFPWMIVFMGFMTLLFKFSFKKRKVLTSQGEPLQPELESKVAEKTERNHVYENHTWVD